MVLGEIEEIEQRIRSENWVWVGLGFFLFLLGGGAVVLGWMTEEISGGCCLGSICLIPGILLVIVGILGVKNARKKAEAEIERKELERKQAIEYAENLTKARRFEDAAKIYESLGMWEEAGRVREMARISKRITVTVNLNKLLQQLKEGGITTTYKCPNCGAPINIDGNTTESALKFCSYCGAALKTTDLVDFIQKILQSPH